MNIRPEIINYHGKNNGMEFTKRSRAFAGPLLILLCMALRATDVLFRAKTRHVIGPLEMICLEHLIACVVLLPWFPGLAPLKGLSGRERLALVFVACGVSVGGILCFTAAFGFINPAVVILLQKLQPVVTILLSIVFLRERMPWHFYPLAGMAIAAGYVLVFGFHLPSQALHGKTWWGALLALSAALLWGSGTALGKSLLHSLAPPMLTRYRYYVGLAFSLLLWLLWHKMAVPQVVHHPKLLLNIAYMSLVPGMAALFFFYRGLRTTPAAVASIVELFFPVASVALAWLFLGQKLTPTQLAAAVILLGCMLLITRLGGPALPPTTSENVSAQGGPPGCASPPEKGTVLKSWATWRAERPSFWTNGRPKA